MNLYEISAELLDLSHALDEEDFSDEQRDAAIAEYLRTGNVVDKVDGYCCLVRNLSGQAAARKAEATRMADLARTDQNKAERLKDRLLWFLRDVAQVKHMSTDRFNLTVADNGGAVPLIVPPDPSDWPVEFVREVRSEMLDKEAVRKALEAGEEVSGCSLGTRGQNLRIR